MRASMGSCAETFKTAALALSLLGVGWACGGVDDPYDDGVDYGGLLQACVASNACAVKKYPRVSDCVDAYYNLHRPFGVSPVYDAIYRCVNRARGDCDKIYDCYGVGRTAGKCDISYKARCEGDKAISCDLVGSYRVFVLDCAEAGLGCAVRAGTAAFTATCGRGSCDTSFKPECEGNVRWACEEGVKAPYDCAKMYTVCGQDTAGTAKCVGNSKETCTVYGPGAFSPRCAGNVALTCVEGYVRKENCSKRRIGTLCREGECTDAFKDCDQSFDRCNGAALQACLDGKWVTFDCAAQGFGACQEELYGAICTPLS